MRLNLLNNPDFANLQYLDWELILNDLSSSLFFESGMETIRNGLSHRPLSAINQQYDSIDFFFQKVDRLEELRTIILYHHIPKKINFQIKLSAILKAIILPVDEMNFFANIFESFTQLEREVHNAPFLLSSRQSLDQNKYRKIKQTFVAPLRSFVDVHSNIDYQGHPALAPIYAKILKVERNIKDQIRAFIKSANIANILQYDNYDIINDHYVIPIRSDSYNAGLGKIIARSSTGQTLYVTPFIILDLSNELLILKASLEKAINDILSELSVVIQEHAEDFSYLYGQLELFDQYVAKTLFCAKYNLTRPVFSEKFVIELEDFFHPLISRPVKNSLRLGHTSSGLIISGPNTGGKTVVLKTISLCYLFVQMGLYVPASHATLSNITSLCYFSNDQQDLRQGLSSFAAEVRNYLQLVNELSETNVVLIDEIFNSTSSDEASALALALLEEIHARSQSKIIISTHHQILKTSIHNDTRYISAHVGIDNQTALPNYRPFCDGPGSSMAMAIFKNISANFHFITDIFGNFSRRLDQKQKTYDRLLEELSKKKAELDKLLSENKQINEFLANQKRAQEGAILLEKQAILLAHEKKISKLTEQAQALLSHIRDLEKAERKNCLASISEIKAEITSEKNEVFSNTQEKESGHLIKIDKSQLIIGNNYYSLSLKKNVSLDKINLKKGQANVSHKNLSFVLPLDDLMGNIGFKQKSTPPPVAINISSPAQIEVDCRGLTLDEFKQVVEGQLSNLVLENIPFVSLIHGHGNGVLKNWLRSTFKNDPAIEMVFDPSNDGYTQLKLK